MFLLRAHDPLRYGGPVQPLEEVVEASRHGVPHTRLVQQNPHARGLAALPLLLARLFGRAGDPAEPAPARRGHRRAG